MSAVNARTRIKPGIEKKITGIPRTSQLFLLVTPAALWLLILLVLPLITLVVLSFQKSAFGTDSTVFSTGSYLEFFQNSSYQRLMLRSLGIAFLVSLLTVLLAYPLAYYMAFFGGEKQSLMLNLLIIPAWTSFLLRVLAWRVILGSSGLLNTFLLWTGLTREPLGGLFYSPTAVVITLIYIWVPFAALPIYVALQRIEPGLLEAASDLGSKPWQAFLRVTFPLSVPGMVAGFLFVFIPTVGEYVTPAMVGGPNGLMIGNIIWDQFSRGLDWPMGAVLSLMVLIAVLIPLLLAARFAQRSGLLGGNA